MTKAEAMTSPTKIENACRERRENIARESAYERVKEEIDSFFHQYSACLQWACRNLEHIQEGEAAEMLQTRMKHIQRICVKMMRIWLGFRREYLKGKR